MQEIAIIEGSLPTTQGLNKELFGRWIEYIDATPKTVETYTRSIRQFWGYMVANGIQSPTRADIMAYRNDLAETHKPTTVKAYMVAVKLFFRWAAQEGLYSNIADRIKGGKLDAKHKKDYLSSKQVGAILGKIDRSTLRGKRDYALLVLMVTTGLRTIEITRARVEDMRTLGDFTALYVQGKGRTEKAEYVKVSGVAEAALREYLAASGAGPTSPLFCSIARRNTGEAMTTRSISRVVKERFIEAGYNSDRLTAHSLRHTAATLNLLNGASVDETMQLLRHRNIATTMIYNHALERGKNNSEERISRAIFG